VKLLCSSKGIDSEQSLFSSKIRGEERDCERDVQATGGD